MTTVVMECSYRVCAPESALAEVAVAATEIARQAFPATVEFSAATCAAESTLLRRQWAHINGRAAGEGIELAVWDLHFAFRGDRRQLTSPRLESLSRAVLRVLEPAGSAPPGGHIPWILTLDTAPDERQRASILERHSLVSTANTQFA